MIGRAGNPPSVFRSMRGGTLRVTSHNANGLLAADWSVRRPKIKFFLRHTARADVVLLQEVHGDQYRLEACCRDIARLFWMCDAPGVGAVCTLLRKTTFIHRPYTSKVLIPGRVLRTAVFIEGTEFVFWNIHNFGMSSRAVRKVVRRALYDHGQACASPGNFLPFSLGTSTSRALTTCNTSRPRRRQPSYR
jgi:hypothetical protein